MESERTINNDCVVSYHNRFLQVERQSKHYAPVKATVVVCEWEDGRIEIEYRGQRLKWHELAERPAGVVEAASVRRTHRSPGAAAEHPWRQSYQTMRVAGHQAKA